MSARQESWSRPAERPPAALVLAGTVAVFLVSWALLHHGFYRHRQIVDTPVYEKYGDWMADGRIPYRDFRPEYPPAALPIFAIPSLVQGEPRDAGRYRQVFEALMALCGVGVLVSLSLTLSGLGANPRRTASVLTFAAAAPLALGSVVLSRFDLWPAALTSAALAAFLTGRNRLGSGALGLATAAKVYPAVAVPLLAVWLWRRHGPRAAWLCAAVFASVLAACVLPFLVIAPGGVASSLNEQLSRPLQIESLGAALLLTAKHVGDFALHMESSHGSQNIGGGPGVAVGWLQTIVQAAALIGIWVAFARGRSEPERLVRYTAAAVVAFVALGKVLSPQFLIWLVPLVPLVRGRRGLAASALLAGAIVMTQLWFPYHYWDYALTFDTTVSWLVLGRDALLVVLLVVLVLPTRATALDRGEPVAGDGRTERADRLER